MNNHLNNFKQYLITESPDVNNCWEELKTICQVNSYSPKETILTSEERCDFFYFLSSGTLRGFQYTDKGDEKTKFIFSRQLLFTNYESYENNEISSTNIVTVDESFVIKIPKEKYVDFLSRHPSFSLLMIQLLIRTISRILKRRSKLDLLKPYDRYLFVREHMPSVFNNVPQQFIASYLNMTPVSLSRMNKRYLESLKK
ncbi:Crp/Fnr family transcriptional regulator [Halosquirtibacter xylanolyticus]|uniref:Crp/Fnr family transcriptional regulator n=1 Tax=Halosquirtibacter xylanolyticus TaxID=3374599 RepID=UPI003749C499|nr:Crp/Fnr family transcriptional regulator [Prolixibacteraceae bacterium]